MSDKPSVTSQLLYNKNNSTVPALASEKIFISNTTFYEYRGTQEIVIRVASSESNLFLDGRHSFLRLDIENPNAYDVYFDGFSPVIIDRMSITCGGVEIENQRHYGRRINTMLTHYGSDEFQKEMAIISGFPTQFGTQGEFVTNGDNVGNNKIPAAVGSKKGKVTLAIPIISDFLQSKLLPLAFMGTSYLELHFWLQDPRIALLIDGTADGHGGRTHSEANVAEINYQITKAEFVSNCIAIKDNSLMASLQSQLETNSLYITGKTWTAYEQFEPASNKTNLTYTINDKSASMCYVINGQYLMQASPFISNNHPAVFGQKNYSFTVGSENFPRSRPIEFNDTTTNMSFMNPYLQCQRVSCSGAGFFNTGNHTSVNLQNFSLQNPSNCLEFGTASDKGKIPNDSTLTIINKPSCFVNAYSFCSFDNISGSSDVGINTRALNLPLNLNITRDLTTYVGGKKIDGSGDYTAPVIPALLNVTWVCSDVIWQLDGSRQWRVDK